MKVDSTVSEKIKRKECINLLRYLRGEVMFSNFGSTALSDNPFFPFFSPEIPLELVIWELNQNFKQGKAITVA